VKWPLFPEEEVIEASARAFAEGLICKVCIQVVSSNGVFERMISFIERLRRRCPVPISLSAADADVKTMEALVSAGVERLAIPLDAASPALFSLIKKADWDERIQSLHTASRLFSRGAATHLIAGLGEEEREMTELMSALYADRITVGLFAFTPLRGTAMENRMPPSLCSYRRVQAAHHLIRNGIVWPIAYDSGRIVFEGDREALRAILSDGRAFRTTGCDNCNRPYYNERAGGVMYNYPRPLTEDECRTALCEALDS
jgi:biotin synthase